MLSPRVHSSETVYMTRFSENANSCIDLCARMRFVVNVFDPIFDHRQVRLCCRNILMPHELLQRFDICTVLQHVYRKRIADDLRGQRNVKARCLTIFLQDLPKTLSGKRLTGNALTSAM